jgi:hypothetical protein
MMTMVTGRERSAEEFKALFARADLALAKVRATGSLVSVLEAVPF